MSSNQKVEYTFKILLLGDAAVGKTALVHRFIEGKFIKDYIMTIGMEPYTRYEDLDGHYICYSLWDIAGQDRFKLMRGMFYKGAMGALVVFDLTRRASFENTINWITEAKQYSPNQEFILVGNKNDLKELREIPSSEIKKKAEEVGTFDYIETSALSGENVAEAFTKLGKMLLQLRLDGKV